jgi:hypothetical protein
MKRFLFVALFLGCAQPAYDNYDEMCSDPYGKDSVSSSIGFHYPQAFSIALSPKFNEIDVAEAQKGCNAWERATNGKIRCFAYLDSDMKPDHDSVLVHKCANTKYSNADVATYPSKYSLSEIVFKENVPARAKTFTHEIGHVLGLFDYYPSEGEATAMVPVYSRMADSPTEIDVQRLDRIWQ